ncbi:hypothetical protein NIES4072_31110 [Nostoc commune NIES-4072]|uniref:Uncharacterized protein n=1 Tax=Nostoc commune NIES-4072 TaxID=2005467 RepID=A0A2R5FTB6_NOSCO|nr:hypothetical protein [Nostoc commune]BBD69556.1 hypothetical protein NIES4070_59650 [Nostoc commune HK-02]GBG19443.1 hypothetical protein NIES4072_31110 [Nostoc commune NIES-4072]
MITTKVLVTTVKKSFDAAPEVANELVAIAHEMGIPQSAVIVVALEAYFLDYYRKKHEKMRFKAPVEVPKQLLTA